jgi:SNF2 family DNA or RNA helicase
VQITFLDGFFLARAEARHNAALRVAGFAFHPGRGLCGAPQAISCPICRRGLDRVWWTKTPAVAAKLEIYADPAAVKELRGHQDALAASRATKTRRKIATPPGLELFPYQAAGVEYLLSHDAALLADDMGLGKTPQSLCLVNELKEIRSVLVVCPASLRINWLREARRWLVSDGRRWDFLVVEKTEPVPSSRNFVVVNYERLAGRKTDCPRCAGEAHRLYPCETCGGSGLDPKEPKYVCSSCAGKRQVTCASCRGRGKLAMKNPIADSLAERTFDLVVCDEAHYLKNPDSARARAILGDLRRRQGGLVQRCKRKIFATGTPIMNRPIEAWPLLAACAPATFGDYWHFAERYCGAHREVVAKGKTVWNTDGASNLDELQNKARSTCMVRRLKTEVLTELPAKIRQIIPLPVSASDRRLIDDELAAWMEKWGAELELLTQKIRVAEKNKDLATYEEAVRTLEYLQRVSFVEMSHTRHMVALAKLPYVTDFVRETLEGSAGKLVVFAHHQDVIRGLLAELASFGAVALYGPMGAAERQAAVDAFQTDPACRLFVGSIAAAGVGLTLTAASTVQFAEEDWTPAQITQCEDRLHRIGQKNCVTVQHLVWDGSLDARMCQIVVAKQKIADLALDSGAALPSVGPELEAPEPVPSDEKILLAMAVEALQRQTAFLPADAATGRKLAEKAGGLTDEEAHLARKLAGKYAYELGDELKTGLGLVARERPRGWTKKPKLGGPSAVSFLRDER